MFTKLELINKLPPYKNNNYWFAQDSVIGVPVVAQRLTNPTRNHEVADLIPGFAQWVGDPVLLWAVM